MEANSVNFSFQPLTNDSVQIYTSKREGETRIGETLTELRKAKFVILGIEESVGPRANFGRAGAENAFASFLSTFLNQQANEFSTGEGIHILGEIKCNYKNEPSDLRELVAELDDFVFSILMQNLSIDQIPIVIGGGHNNAYPLIRFSRTRFNQPIQVANLDAHADYRRLEGRHSGNSFSYAYKNDFLKKYTVFGLHQGYNNQDMLDNLRKDGHSFTFHEDYLFGGRDYDTDFNQFVEQSNKENEIVGLELDLDAIERMPSSAFTPVGISMDIARLYSHQMAKLHNVAYFHLPEGAPLNEQEERIVGKTLSYLVTDFIKSHKKTIKI